MGIHFLRECEAVRMPAFVVCMAGVGRSPTLVLAHLLAGEFREQGPDAALEFLTARRPVVHPSPQQIEAAVLAARSW
jgi:protein-tyrosine phosphatase